MTRASQPPEPQSARDRRIARWLGLAVFLACLPFFHGHFTGTDEMGVFLTTRALYEDGGFEVRGGPHRFRGRDGRTFAHFAPGLPVLALPFYAVGDLAERALPEVWVAALSGRPREAERIDTLGSPRTFAVALLPALATAWLVAVFFRVQRRLGASAESAVVASAILGGATYVGTHSVYLLRHTAEALPWLAAFLALLRFRDGRQARDLALASGWASLTLLLSVPGTVAIPALAGYGLSLAAPELRTGTARRRSRLLAAALLPAVVAVALHVLHNQALWGTWLESPMVAQRHGFTTPLLVGLAGFLLSPGVSVFVYSPPLLGLGLWGPRFWREQRAACATAIVAALSLLLFCAGFSLWHGLWSAPGPRYLFLLAPLGLLGLGPWLDVATPGRRRVVWLLAGTGVVVQLVLVASRWSAVIRGMGYVADAERGDLGFLWSVTRSPLAGSVRALAEGQLDSWWLGLATGHGVGDAAPVAALVLAVLWAGACLGTGRRLIRALREA